MSNMQNEFDNAQSKTDYPTLRIDWAAYLPLIEDQDIPIEDKRELIKTLWSIMVAFVDLGFGIHPHQQSCGETAHDLAAALSDVVHSDQSDTPKDDTPPAPYGPAKRKESPCPTTPKL